MTVGLLLDSLKLKDPKAENGRVMDDWIYVQERDVKIGRLQLFNNWSPYMVKDPDTVFMGLEYFCDEGDEMWNTPDQEFIDFAVGELEKLGIVERSHVKDAVLIRVPKRIPPISEPTGSSVKSGNLPIPLRTCFCWAGTASTAITTWITPC